MDLNVGTVEGCDFGGIGHGAYLALPAVLNLREFYGTGIMVVARQNKFLSWQYQ